MKNLNHPPSWIDRFLQWRLPQEQFEEVQGDMHELYGQWLAQVGEPKAHRRYLWTALTFLRPLPKPKKAFYSIHHTYPQANPIDMLQNYFTIALRTFYKNKLHTTINMLGMAVAITSILLIELYIRHELTYDQFHTQVERIVLVGEESAGEEEASLVSVFPALPELLKEYPGIENGTRIFPHQSNWVSYGNKEFEERLTFADTGFFHVFTFPFLKGDAQTALHYPSSVVLSQETAGKLFGDTDPIGKTVTFDNGKQLIVRGVLAPVPANSTLTPKVIVPIAELTDFAPWVKNNADWYNSFTTTFLLLSPATNARQLEAQLPGFVRKYYSEGAKERKLNLLPFKELHKAQVDNSTYIYGLGCVAVFLLLVACINFTNLSIATSLTRIREVAIRKTLGSSRKQLIFQFLAEACIISLLSLFIGIVLTSVLLPTLNTLLDMNLQLQSWQSPVRMLLLLALAMGVGLLAGLYPSLFFSALRPANALKGKISQQPASLQIRNGLVVVQFTIAVFLTTGTLLVYKQIQFMKQADLRFNEENVLVVDLNLGYKNEKAANSQINFVLNELRSKPEIAGFSTSKNIPGRYWHNYNSYAPEGKTHEPVSLRMTDVDEGYLSTYGIRLLEGRNFSLNTATDTAQSVMINKAAMKAFGWETAVGKKLYDQGSNQVWQIVGVMDDFHYQSLQGKVEPLIHFYTGPSRIENNNFLSIKVKPQQASSLITFLKEQWQQLPSRKEFTYYFVDEEFNKQYLNVERSLSLITFFTTLTILIACAGIFALTSLATQVRSKEIGIRKVLGAGVVTIVSLFFKDYLKLVSVAILIACPLVYYAVHLWLQNFAYKISIGPWAFVASSGIIILIALLTISYQTIRAAVVNPVKALRNE